MTTPEQLFSTFCITNTNTCSCPLPSGEMHNNNNYRNTFCGLRYLPIAKLYCIFFMAHERNGHLSTSGRKSDVNVVFLQVPTRFPNRGKNFSDLHTFKADRAYRVINICMNFQDRSQLNRSFGGKIMEEVLQCWPQRTRFYFGAFMSVPILVKIDEEWECAQLWGR